MRPDPRLLQPFVTLAEELHFGRAAARLGITQPTLSQQIARLELQLGVRLFHRTRSSVALTDAGAALVPSARAAVEAAGALERTGAALARGELGELRLGFSPGAHYLVERLLAEFARRRPGVRVRALQDSSGALAEAVARADVEVAIGFCARPRPEVVCEHLVAEPAVLAVAGDHPLAASDGLHLEDLRNERFALVDAADGPGYNDAVVTLCRSAGFEPRTPPEPHGPMAWETAVRTGDCVGLTTRTAAVSSARGLRLLRLHGVLTFPIQLLRPADGGDSARPAARAFADLARELCDTG
jgi:LysR family transcriptional regulator, benzoate and cis,cis-muconate-responsive activator of ben and cat genes